MDDQAKKLCWDGWQVYKYAKRVMTDAATTGNLTTFSFVVREVLNYSPPLRDLWPTVNRMLNRYREDMRRFRQAADPGESTSGLEKIYINELNQKIKAIIYNHLAAA